MMYGAVARLCRLRLGRAGRLDAYWELGIYPWDTAAGELLVREAGGVATDFHDNPDHILQRRSIIVSALLNYTKD